MLTTDSGQHRLEQVSAGGIDQGLSADR